MELYYGDAFDDLVVPKDEEISDRLPSPGSWSKWVVMAPQGLAFPGFNKQGAEADDSSMVEDESGLMVEEFLCNECSDSGKRRLDGVAAASVRSSEYSLGRMAFSDDQSEDQHDYLEGIGQMDDSFMNSLLEGLPQNHSAPGPLSFPPSSDGCGMPADYLCSDMDVDSQIFQSDARAVGRGKYIKKHAFSPSCSLEGSQVLASHLTSSKLQNKDCPQSEVQTSSLSEQITEDGHVNEVSLEESVLQELETALGQLTSKTRICFRDALYRLAQNSRKHGVLQDQESDQSVKNALNSSAGKKTLESETNPVDRAVATLMFDKMDVNVRDFPVPASLCSTFGFSDSTHAVNFRASNQARGGDGRKHYASLQGDVEVPIFGLVAQQMQS